MGASKTSVFTSCGHAYHTQCFRDTLTGNTDPESNVHGEPIRCFTCPSEVALPDLRACIDDNVFAAAVTASLDRFVTTSGGRYRPCSAGKHVCKWVYAVENNAAGVPCQCPLCGFQFCKSCGRETLPHHQGRTCAELVEFERRMLADDYATWDKSLFTSCIACHVRILRPDGCNHMRCHCGQHFCMRCRAPLDASDPYFHYRDPASVCYHKCNDTTPL